MTLMTLSGNKSDRLTLMTSGTEGHIIGLYSYGVGLQILDTPLTAAYFNVSTEITDLLFESTCNLVDKSSDSKHNKPTIGLLYPCY